MVSTCHSSFFARFVTVASIALILAAPFGPAVDNVAASPQPVNARFDLQAVVGFSDRFRPGYWTPLSLSIGNLGDAFDGDIEVLTRDGDALGQVSFTVHHRRSLSLARDARKRLNFTVYLEQLSYPLTIRLLSSERLVFEHTIDLRERFIDERILLVIGRDTDLDYLSGQGADQFRVLYPLPALLPEHWQGYDAVDAVIIHGTSLESLRPKQYQALRMWLDSGGTIVVSGTPDYSSLRSERLRALLPAQPIGLVEVSNAQAVADTFALPFAHRAPFHINRVIAVTDGVIYQVAGLPLAIEQQRGRGRVLYFTFDIARSPFDRWNEMGQLWQRHLPTASRQSIAQRDQFEAQDINPVAALLETVRKGFPGHGVVLFFGALYLGTLAACQSTQGASRAAIRSAVAIAWLAPLLFAFAAWALGSRALFHDGPSLVAVSLIQPLPDSAYARVEVELGLFANRQHVLNASVRGMSPTWRATHPAWRDQAPIDWTFVNGMRGLASVTPHPVRKFELYRLRGDDLVAFAVTARLSESDSGVEIVLHNDSGRHLRALRLLHGDYAYEVGDVGIDASITRHFTHGIGRDRLHPFDEVNALGVGQREVANMLFARLKATPDASDSKDLASVVIGFVDTPYRFVGDRDEWQVSEVHVVMMPVDASANAKASGATVR